MKRKGLTALLWLVVALAIFSGCASSSGTAVAPGEAGLYDRNDNASPSVTASTTAPSAESDMKGSEDGGTGITGIGSGYIPDATKKIIRNANVSMESKEFDVTIKAVESLVNESQGYVENSSMSESGGGYRGEDGQYVRYRYASYTLRVPKEQYDNFLTKASEAGNVVSLETYISDITSKYVDTEARLKALRTQEETLLGMMSKATLVEDMITIESKLTEVRYEIESLTATLRIWQNDVDYSTIQLSVSEVSRLTPQTPVVRTFWQRVSDSFTSSIESIADGSREFAIWLAGALPVLVILAAVALIIIVIVRRGIKRRRLREAGAPFEPILPQEPKKDE